MKNLLLMLALIAPLALAACDNNSDTTTSSVDNPAVMEPAAGEDDATAGTTDAAEPTTTSDTMTTTTPSGDIVTTTTTTTTESPAAEGIAIGEPNPATACGDHAAWVGQTQAEIQSEIDALGGKVRVLGPDTPATMDYSPERTNVIVDNDGVVTEVRCG